LEALGPVARVELLGVGADGKRFPISLEIGQPYKVDDHLWACPVAVGGLYERLAEQRGADALQALGLAMGLMRRLLVGFLEDGGRLVFPDAPDQDVPLDSYFPGLSQTLSGTGV
jgi:hypothetical protein